MLRSSKQWDVRCPTALTDMFPDRSGYYYKVDRQQARAMVAILCRAYGIDPSLVTVSDDKPYGGNNGVCWFLKNRRSRIDVHGRAHLKSVWHEWYHALDHATDHRKYNSSDRTGGPASLAWQFADRLFEVFRNQRPSYTKLSEKTTMSAKKTRRTNKSSHKTVRAERQSHERITVKDNTRVRFVKMRDKGGQRTALLKLIPKSGISVSKLSAAAKKAELDAGKVKSNVAKLVYYGFATAA